ncbi:MAG: carbohydrate ABC transporter permease [Opitutales bacterium]
MSPFLVTFGLFTVVPLTQSLVLAFQQTFGPEYTRWVGLANFLNLMHDPDFWTAVRNTFTYAVLSVALGMPLSLGLAMMLNRPSLKGRSVFRLIFFMPSLVGLVFVAMIFQLLFGRSKGLINEVLHEVVPGFPPEFPWLEEHVMASLILVSLWLYVGFNMIYFLAALQNVSQDLLEAAEIDGANAWQRFWHVTLPEIRPVFGFVMLISAIGSLQLFELPYILLDQTAGPENRGLTVVMYLYQNGFEQNDLGYASAIGWVLAIFLIIVAIIQRRLLESNR